MVQAVTRRIARRLGHETFIAPWLFMREALDQPAAIGAIWPSSGRLARRMAERVPRHGEGLVVELGAGTGAVTRALLEHGIAPERLRVIERSPVFVAHLRRRFPGVAIVHGDAARLQRLLRPGARVDAIVSSLPLRSLSPREAHAIVAQWRALLAPQGVVVQFTYHLGRADDLCFPGFRQHSSEIVWANVPPARVLTLEGRDRINRDEPRSRLRRGQA